MRYHNGGERVACELELCDSPRMKSVSVLLLAFATPLAAAACAGAATGSARGPGSIVVPPQPPQPVAPPPVVPSVTATAVAPVAASPFRCDGGKRFEIGPRSYCGYAEAETWEASERRCVASGGHLVTLDTEATSEALHQALGSPLGAGRAAWIGLELKVKGKAGPNEWKWSSGEPVKATPTGDVANGGSPAAMLPAKPIGKTPRDAGPPSPAPQKKRSTVFGL